MPKLYGPYLSFKAAGLLPGDYIRIHENRVQYRGERYVTGVQQIVACPTSNKPSVVNSLGGYYNGNLCVYEKVEPQIKKSFATFMQKYNPKE